MIDYIKWSLRQSQKLVREKLSVSYQAKASNIICTKIQELKLYNIAKRIGFYQATRGEINLNSLWQLACVQQKFCYFPVIRPDKTLSFLPATSTTAFVENSYSIKEPKVSLMEAVEINKLDIIFIPIVAFDMYCTRIGTGAGYYDRTLQSINSPKLIGVAYEFQCEFYIEPQPWDITLHAIVTPENIYWKNHVLANEI